MEKRLGALCLWALVQTVQARPAYAVVPFLPPAVARPQRHGDSRRASPIRRLPRADKTATEPLSSSPATLAPSLARSRLASPISPPPARSSPPTSFDSAATATALPRRRSGSDRRRPLLLSVPLDRAGRPYNELHDLASSSRTPAIAAPIRRLEPPPSPHSHICRSR
jgi:hypothetical protein